MTLSDFTAFDTSIFTYDPASKIFDINTDLKSNEGTVRFALKGFQVEYTLTRILYFDVNILPACKCDPTYFLETYVESYFQVSYHYDFGFP